MKLSEYLLPSLKEKPNDVVIPSHSLMLRAGLIRKMGSGFYAYLPFGLKVLRKVEAIIREEMNLSGGQEFLFPLLVSRSLWETSGRWRTFQEELFRLKDRAENDYALGPTHEETFATFFKQEVSSYKNLPLLLYQIAPKFRDEIRPRYGVMRSKEFLMKDAYSFHLDDASLDKTYKLMHKTYKRIFERMGLDFISVKADSGTMGGEGSEEFMAKSEVGEETLIHCSKCDYSANLETAEEEIIAPSVDFVDFETHDYYTPDKETIPAVAQALNFSESVFIKSLLYEVKKKDKTSTIMLLIRGDYEVNPIKLQHLFPESFISPLNAQKMKQDGYIKGYIGFKEGKSINDLYYVDETLQKGEYFISGANVKDYHRLVKKFQGLKKELKMQECSVYQARPLGRCKKCGGELQSSKGIEVGHIFKLGKKYTKAFDCAILDKEGKPQLPTMGCYGIGLNRTLAAIIEQNHDQDGIKWPKSVSPFAIHLVTVNIKDEASLTFSRQVYEDLSQKGLEVLWDDRPRHAGFKFKEADLLGLPLQVIVGPKRLAEGQVEIKIRQNGQKQKVKTKELIDVIAQLLKEETF